MRNNIFSLLFSYILMYVSGESNTTPQTQINIVELLGQGIQKEIVTIKQPIDETLVSIGSASLVGADALRLGVQKEIQAVKQPVDVTVTYIGSSQCANVKKLFGVSYEQIKGEREPNLENLALHYKTQFFTTIIKIEAAAESLRHARTFDSDEKLVVFVHGFTDDPTKEGFTKMFQAFSSSGRVSLIALDASSLIRFLYIRASTYVRFIGEKLGEVLATVYKNGQDPALIHIIGHSLGAHISGFAGKTFQNMTGTKVGRISGLDPAGPCFSSLEAELKIKDTDADFVDIIHSDAGVYGINENVGQVDFYPNNGRQQPNCVLQTCSHSLAVSMYAASVEYPQAFPALKCKSWNAFKKGDCDPEISYMGYAATAGTNGTYYLQTSGTYPYGLGVEGTKYRNTDGILTNIGNFLG